MARRFTSLLTVLLLAGIPGFSQVSIPGVGYPGGGYPGGGYPGRRYPQQGPMPGSGQTTSQTNNQTNNQTTFTGILRSIGDKNVIIEADDKTITTISTGSTKYVGNSGSSAKIGDFQPGDHVKIDAKQDNKNVYRATTMTLMKAGTAEEHSAASLAMDNPTQPLPGNASGDSSSSGNTSSSAGGNPSSGSSGNGNNGNRPQLRRAASSSDNASNNTSSSSNDDDPDRPRLRRAASSSDNTSSSSDSASSRSSSTSSNDSDPDRPRIRRAVSNADGTPRAEIIPGDSAPTPSSTASPRGSDDPGPPQLRRARPSTDSDAAIADARPSLHADDSNGVTRMPPPPQLGAPSDGASSASTRAPQRMPLSGDDVIDQARDEAFSFTETLPNYVVKQFTTRYATAAARGGKTSWQALDTVTADVIEENGTEKYKNILVNGKPPRQDVEKSGSWSKGEFSSLQLDILSPLTNADFHGKRATTIVNRAAFRFDFSVEQANSHWHVESEGQTNMPAYTGTIWIDKQNYRVLRIELAAQNMPRSFPLDQVESSVDYDYVLIGDGKYLLPTHSEALSCAHGANNCTRNVIEFRNYKKFSADTSITFDADK